MSNVRNVIRLFGTTSALILVLLPAACRDRKALPGPAPSASAPVTASTPAAPGPTASVTTTTTEPTDTWLAVSKGGVELGLIELRAGKPPKLTAESDHADAKALGEKLQKIGGPDGIGLDMHLPSASGEGRGPYGTRIIKYGDPLYRHAVKNALEPEYSVKQVAELVDALPPAKFRRLHVSRSGEKVGFFDFATTPPTLTVETEKSDGIGMTNNLDWIKKLGEIKVRYQHAQNGVQTLVTATAKPGDPNYAQTVALFLIIEREYRTRYAYKLEFVE